MKYRPDIDGLRAVAILPVLFFHAGFAWMPGGFLGVDVFFVISGYLITSIMIHENSQQRFSLASFYERRARRILPALFFVMAATLIAAWFLQSPLEYMNLAESIISANLFSANIYFWQHIDYFTGDTNLLPMLHLWSLGIEEQFYFLLPLLFIALWPSKRNLLYSIIAIFVLSLITAHLTQPTYSSAAFYLLPTRAWELVAGALCAFYLANKPAQQSPTLYHHLGSVLGLLLLLVSLLLYKSKLPHPSLWTLIPVAGSVLIVLCATPHTYVAKLLSLRPLVWIGLLSYSAYLWHQPLFALMRTYRLQPQLGLKTTIGLIIITFVMSAISWRFVETPFRNRQFLRQRTVFLCALIGTLFFIAVSAIILWQQGFPKRFNAIQQVLHAQQLRQQTQSADRDSCFLNEHSGPEQLDPSCKITATTNLIIMGDSHAEHLTMGFTAAGDNPAIYTGSGCPPIKDVNLSPWRPYCNDLVTATLTDIANTPPATIVLHANWLMYQDWIDHHATDNTPMDVQLRHTLEYLQHIAPTSQIVVIGDVPQWQPSLISILSQEAQTATPSPYLPNASLPALYALESRLKAAIPEGVTFISLADELCQDGSCLALVEGAEHIMPMAWDYGHVTAEGSDYLRGILLQHLPLLAPTLE